MSRPRVARKNVGNATRKTWTDAEVRTLVEAVLAARETGLVCRMLDVVSHGESVSAGLSVLARAFRQRRRSLDPHALLACDAWPAGTRQMDTDWFFGMVNTGLAGDPENRIFLKDLAADIVATVERAAKTATAARTASLDRLDAVERLRQRDRQRRSA
jgi:hypothetical protein